MRRKGQLAWALSLATLFAGAAARAADRQVVSFDKGWKFHLGEIADGQKTETFDGDWRALNVPHDFSIEGPAGADPATMEGPFDRRSPAGAGGGSLNAGIAWYRKTFTAPANPNGLRTSIDFDGVYMDSDVYLNGALLGNHPYGYTSFSYDLTPQLKAGQLNTIAVRVNVQQPCSRWYSGAGIYRHVWLTTTNPVHVSKWGTYITTPEVSDASAKIVVRTKVQYDVPGNTPADRMPPNAAVTVTTHLLDPDGKEIATLDMPVEVAAATEKEISPSFVISNPRRWSLETPLRYTARTEVKVGGSVVDTYATPFGIRTIKFTADGGFFLNDKHVPLQGVCDHHDLGCLGSAVNTRAIERQLEVLREFGVNSIRTSHNPPAPELLELCDKMGFVVMDEAFDEWKRSKTRNGYGRFFDLWSEPDIVSMLRRDRNHPSIIMWSIGNEIGEQGDNANGKAMAQRLADFCHAEDPTRYVTSACNNAPNAVRTGYAAALDVLGINYNIPLYTTYKGRVMVASETSSALSTRGEYGLYIDGEGKVQVQRENNNNRDGASYFQVPSYDIDRPGWGHLAETDLIGVKNAPWIAGEYVWTGFDYIGEPTPYGWPSRSSYFGIVDLAGFKKDRFYIYQSQWTNKPVVHLLPHWNWEGFEGKEIPVWCTTNADSVELFVNGMSMGEKKGPGDMRSTMLGMPPPRGRGATTAPAGPTARDTLHFEWQVPYAAGSIKAIGKKNGLVIGTDEIFTAGKPAKMILTADRAKIHADGDDLSFVTVAIVDANGHPCPNAMNQLTFRITGAGTLAGTDNGDPINHESFQAPTRKAFHGLALVVLRSTEQAGAIQLEATAEGLPVANTTVMTGQ